MIGWLDSTKYLEEKNTRNMNGKSREIHQGTTCVWLRGYGIKKTWLDGKSQLFILEV
jgi:hypothetical protein